MKSLVKYYCKASWVPTITLSNGEDTIEEAASNEIGTMKVFFG